MLFMRNAFFLPVSEQSNNLRHPVTDILYSLYKKYNEPHDRHLILMIGQDFKEQTLTISGEEAKPILGDELDKNMEKYLYTDIKRSGRKSK